MRQKSGALRTQHTVQRTDERIGVPAASVARAISVRVCPSSSPHELGVQQVPGVKRRRSPLDTPARLPTYRQVSIVFAN